MDHENRQAQKFTRLAGQARGWLAQAHTPGLALAVLEGGRTVFARGYGLKHAGGPDPVSADTVFEFGSLSKPLFACAVLQLAAIGRLDLDTPLDRYLPQSYLPGVPPAAEITARHVLSHTTGFPNWRPDGEPLQVHFAPGSRFSYSGEGFVFLQHAVEALVGEGLEAYLQRMLLQPLGMRGSSYVWQPVYVQQAAWGHSADGAPVGDEDMERRKGHQANAAYSLYSSVADLARLLEGLFAGYPSGEALLPPEVWARALEPQVPVNDLPPWKDGWPEGGWTPDPEVAWGLGWGVQRPPAGRAFWHWGDNGPFQTFVFGEPDRGRGLVMAANGRNGRVLWPRLFMALRGAVPPALRWLFAAYEETLPPREASTSTPGEG